MGSPYEKMEILKGRRLVKECPGSTAAPDSSSVSWGRSCFAVKHNLYQPSRYIMVYTPYTSCIYRLFASLALEVPSSLSLTSPGLCCLFPHPALPQAFEFIPRELAPGGISPKIQRNKNLPLIEVDTVGLTSSISF